MARDIRVDSPDRKFTHLAITISPWLGSYNRKIFKNACTESPYSFELTLTRNLNRNLMRKMTTIIDPADDYLAITAAEEQMHVNYARAKKENDEAYANLKCVCRRTMQFHS